MFANLSRPKKEARLGTELFSVRSLMTMFHGIALAGATLMALAAALFSLRAMPSAGLSDEAMERQSRNMVLLLVITAVATWMTVLGGTYLVFPLYRAAPPEGVTELSMYPRSFLLSNPDTAWLHAFAMEVKEHVPWIAGMLTSAAAFVGVRYRATFLADQQLRSTIAVLLVVSLLLVSYAGLLGVLINKVAPVQ